MVIKRGSVWQTDCACMCVCVCVFPVFPPCPDPEGTGGNVQPMQLQMGIRNYNTWCSPSQLPCGWSRVFKPTTTYTALQTWNRKPGKCFTLKLKETVWSPRHVLWHFNNDKSLESTSPRRPPPLFLPPWWLHQFPALLPERSLPGNKAPSLHALPHTQHPHNVWHC